MSDLRWESPGQKQKREQDAQNSIIDIQQFLINEKAERLSYQATQEKIERRRFGVTVVCSVLSLIAAITAAVTGVLSLR